MLTKASTMVEAVQFDAIGGVIGPLLGNWGAIFMT